MCVVVWVDSCASAVKQEVLPQAAAVWKLETCAAAWDSTHSLKQCR